ncbi:2-oxoglutarate-dependent dioxygenase 33 [Cryptomeria japonica]|uniref:2-oxoglutarate-dependent dioxygenase 33 n=1 Tax=Cryptomeria japonica TaxID=3369 RepID=UPI0027DAAA45|nr:2-oxoglutarate-dependent dioxygenase 33 [Cryptomeria japonica]
MASEFKSLPVIDVGPLLEKTEDSEMANDQSVAEVARQLDKACRETGFFYVKGHGVPDHILKEVRDLCREFFHRPSDEKEKIKMSSSTGYRGYQRVGENVTLGQPDLHEAIDCYKNMKPGAYGELGKVLEGSNLWPDYPKRFAPLMEEYISNVQDLAKKIMKGIALGLGMPQDTFEGENGGDPFWVLRIIGYPPIDSDTEEFNMQDSGVGCGAHTDYGLLTLVNQDDDISALQVRNFAGEWIWAVPIPGTFVCNIGDMLKVWTNGFYQPTLHRVINKNPKYRVSVPFFYEPNFDAVVEPLEIFKELTGGKALYSPVIYGNHISGKVSTNFDEIL